MEVISLQNLKLIVQAPLGHDQVVFIERWSLDTSGLYDSFHYFHFIAAIVNKFVFVLISIVPHQLSLKLEAAEVDLT